MVPTAFWLYNSSGRAAQLHTERRASVPWSYLWCHVMPFADLVVFLLTYCDKGACCLRPPSLPNWMLRGHGAEANLLSISWVWITTSMGSEAELCWAHLSRIQCHARSRALVVMKFILQFKCTKLLNLEVGYVATSLREWHCESFSIVFHRPSATQPLSQLPSSQLPSSQLPSSQLHSSQLPPLAKIWQLHALSGLFYCYIVPSLSHSTVQPNRILFWCIGSLEMNRNFRSCRKLCSRLSQADTLAGDKPQSKKLDMEDTSADFRSQR